MKICVCILLEDQDTAFDEKFGEHLKEQFEETLVKTARNAAISYVEKISEKEIVPSEIPKGTHIQIKINGPVRNEAAVRAFDEELGGVKEAIEKIERGVADASSFPFEKLKKEFDWPN